jgi:phage tail tape-measure protein
MRGLLSVLAGIAMLATLATPGAAQVGCPAEIGQAKELLSRKGGLRAEESSQPPRSLAGARQEPEQVAGTQWTGKLVRASRLVQEAEAACKTGDLNTARTRAEAAIAELQ